MLLLCIHLTKKSLLILTFNTVLSKILSINNFTNAVLRFCKYNIKSHTKTIEIHRYTDDHAIDVSFYGGYTTSEII